MPMVHVDARPLRQAVLNVRKEVNSGYLEDIALRRKVLELYDAEHVALRRYLLFLGLTDDAASDVLQDGFLKLHQHLLNGGDSSNLRAWLYRVVHSQARNEQTAHRSTKTEALAEDPAEFRVAAPGQSAEEALLGVEKSRRFRRALSELSPAQRECLILRTRGLKYREIAEVLQISVSTVGENLERGIARMRELI